MASERRKVYRVQGRDGRGPYAPGFTRKWVDDDGPPPPKTCFEEFGDGIIHDMDRLIRIHGGACGCAVSDLSGLSRWFTASERIRLLQLRFNVVSMDIDEVIAESPDQIVFWRRQPLRSGIVFLPWPIPELV